MPTATEHQLDQEITKWHTRLKDRLPTLTATDTAGEDLLANIHAYAADAMHFYEQGDLVRSFEAVVWAWAYLEIGVDQQHLRETEA